MLDSTLAPLEDDLRLLDRVARSVPTIDFLRLAIRGAYRGRIALVVSPGPQAAVLLHLAAGIDRTVPVFLVDGAPDGIWSCDGLADRFGLRDVRPAAAGGLPAGLPDNIEAWIDGRAPRRGAALVEAADGRLALRPLARWSASAIASYVRTNDLPGLPQGAAAAPRPVRHPAYPVISGRA